jgi:acetate CoA/acetoacetate CoA-transferase beta subunit
MDAQTVIAKRIALELRDGTLVNLGIGIPTRVANYVPAGIKVYFQSENGLIGTGAVPEEGMHHRLLTDAGGKPVTALPGACVFDSAMSFGLIRGGHLAMTVLGGLQVDQSGHLANWMIPARWFRDGRRDGPRLGRQARGDRHAAQRQGQVEVVKACNLPLTSARPSNLLVTELAVIAFPGRARDLDGNRARGVGAAGARLRPMRSSRAGHCAEMAI